LVETFIFDDTASFQGRDEPGPGPATELGIDGTDDDVVSDSAIETGDLYGRERGEWNGEGGFLGIKGRELVDKFWVDLADGINVEQTWVLEGLENLTVDIVKISDVLLFIVLLREGHVGVGVVGSGGGNVELGRGEKGVVLRSYYVHVSVLVITVGLWVRVEIGEREESIHGLYSFYTYVLPKTGYPAVVLCVDVATPAREGKGEEGG